MSNKPNNDETIEFLNYIKQVLKSDFELVERIDDIPFTYDKNQIENLCKFEGIDIKYSSTFNKNGKYNKYLPLDKVTFTRKKVR